MPAGNRGAGVRAGQSDHILAARHKGVVTGNAVVRRIAGNDHAETVFAGLLNRHVHAGGRDHHAHPVVTVDNCGCLVIAHNLKLRNGLLDAVVDNAIVVDGLQAPDAMGVDSTLVCGDENIRTDSGIGLRNTDALEDVDHETLHGLEINPT